LVFHGLGEPLQVSQYGFHGKGLFAGVEDCVAQKADARCVDEDFHHLHALQFLEDCRSIQTRINGAHERCKPLGVFVA